MASSSSSATVLAAALGAPPAQLLTRDNALVWKALVVPALRGARVLDLVEGSERAPVEKLEADDENKKKITIENPEYASWIARDQQVLRWLLNALSPDVLVHVIGLETYAEVWAALNAHVSTASKSRAQRLRGALNDTKKNDLTAEKYFAKMKTLASELAAACKPLDEDELICYLIKYKPMIASTNPKIFHFCHLPMLLAVVLLLREATIGGVMIVVDRTVGGMTVLASKTIVDAVTTATARSAVTTAWSVVTIAIARTAVTTVDVAMIMTDVTVAATRVAAMEAAIKADVMMTVHTVVTMATDVMMVGDVVAANPPHMLIPLARSVPFMGIPPMTAGGVMAMTAVTVVIMETKATRMQIMLPMALIQTGTMTLAQLIVSLEN
ncbi:hypothetical protein QYE76_020414 [Lolium multiflorum]|uniref:Retrotransposon gag domain-containing protein n=1 Tax=Lolium multiflorum TaxID=4521 RepID=A0AAD8VP72_LOLMU|nr:hypothetical protein QYE76_020414 [Lolium multiflorum]